MRLRCKLQKNIYDSKELLNALKKVQDVILKADGEEIPFLIKVAQTNLTKTTISLWRFNQN